MSASPARPDAVRSVIRDYLRRVLRQPILRDDQDLFDGIVNSIFAVELVDYIEHEFGVEVEDEDLDVANFRSIDALSRFVEQKRGGD